MYNKHPDLGIGFWDRVQLILGDVIDSPYACNYAFNVTIPYQYGILLGNLLDLWMIHCNIPNKYEKIEEFRSYLTKCTDDFVLSKYLMYLYNQEADRSKVSFILNNVIQAPLELDQLQKLKFFKLLYSLYQTVNLDFKCGVKTYHPIDIIPILYFSDVYRCYQIAGGVLDPESFREAAKHLYILCPFNNDWYQIDRIVVYKSRDYKFQTSNKTSFIFKQFQSHAHIYKEHRTHFKLGFFVEEALTPYLNQSINKAFFSSRVMTAEECELLNSRIEKKISKLRKAPFIEYFY